MTLFQGQQDLQKQRDQLIPFHCARVADFRYTFEFDSHSIPRVQMHPFCFMKKEPRCSSIINALFNCLFIYVILLLQSDRIYRITKVAAMSKFASLTIACEFNFVPDLFTRYWHAERFSLLLFVKFNSKNTFKIRSVIKIKKATSSSN